MENKNLVEGRTGKWEVIIGLEVHAQVSSKSKLFSGAPTEFGAEPNSQVSLVDAAMPGMLPVLNEFCVEQAVKTGLGINAQINKRSVFDRKNYFYADLPQGYQISQLFHPIVGEGEMLIDLPDGETKKIAIERIHLEQDAGKSIHDQSPDSSLIDLNRAGVALMELVTKPDLRSSKEAAEFMKKLRSIVRYLGTCDGDMEKGSMRCDANVSVRRPGGELGTRCEIKNLNSMRNIMKAIDYEVVRQIEILEDGGEIEQQTRLFDVNQGVTKTLRSKEDAMDYRYFPDPDLLPVILSDEYIEKIKQSLPELPDEKKQRYVANWGLTPYDASVLVADQEIAAFFEKVAENSDPKLAVNWISVELFGRLNKAGIALKDSKINAENLIEMLNLIKDGTISGKIAKEVFDILFEEGGMPGEIVEKKGLKQVSDPAEIEKIIDKILSENQDKVEQYRAGKDKLFGFFVGQVMKISGGKVNPAMVNEILKKKLG